MPRRERDAAIVEGDLCHVAFTKSYALLGNYVRDHYGVCFLIVLLTPGSGKLYGFDNLEGPPGPTD